MSSRDDLIQRSISFLREVKDMTPSAEMERWLNETYGPGSELYEDLSRLIRQGVAEGWAANQEVAGPHYRRSRILEPSPEAFHFSVTAVYMDSMDPKAFPDDHGDHHDGDEAGGDDVLRGTITDIPTGS